MKSVLEHLYVLFIVLCCCIASSAQTMVAVQDQGFRITLNPGWKQLDSREDFPNTFFRAASPAGIDAGAVYVNVFDKGGYTPESYRQAVRRYVSTTMQGRVTLEENVHVGDLEAWRVEYEGESVGFSGERRRFLNLVLFQNQKIYVVHCTAKESSWDAMKDSFAQISATLRVF